MAIGKIVAAPQVHRDGPAQRWKKIKDIVAPYPETDPKKFGFWFTAIPQVDVKKGWRPAFALPHGRDEK